MSSSKTTMNITAVGSAACRFCCNMLAAGVGICLVTVSLASAADETTSLVITDDSSKYSAHDYSARVRTSVWLVFVEGDFETENALGESVSVAIDGDLGYNDPYQSLVGDFNFRWGKHDIWITGQIFDEDETNSVDVEFEIDDEVFNVGGDVDTDISFTDYNFGYGYSFFDFEQDGFRLGPTIAVSYTNISLKVTELTVEGIPLDAQFSYEETLPIPTIGLQTEVPYDNLLFSAQAGVFYFNDGDDFEGTGVRANVGVSWRPLDNLGVFAGVRTIYADVDTGRDAIDDLFLWGPTLGLEFRL